MKKKLTVIILMLFVSIFTFSICTNVADAKGITAPQKNAAPVILEGDSKTISIDEDSIPASATFNAKDSNMDSLLAWSIIRGSSNGTASITSSTNSAGSSSVSIKYTPKTNYNGTDSFVLQVRDSKGAIDNITVYITVYAVNDAPVNTVLPAISGIAAVGETLTAGSGIWSDDKDTSSTLKYTYQWQFSTDPNSATGTDLPGATGISYIPNDSDNGKYIRVSVTATDSGEGASPSKSSSAYSTWIAVKTVRYLNYVAIGDSIATGTIYPGTTITSYVTFFYQYIQQQNTDAKVTLQNLAQNGSTSNDLILKLGINDPTTQDTGFTGSISKAHIITISIGGNNLMQATKDSSSLGGYNFDKIDNAIAEQGVKDFSDHWQPIINKVKQLNPNAQIIVNTVYNPYNESDPLHSAVDSYLSGTSVAGTNGINDVINTNSVLGYKIANVYSEFDKYKTTMGTITYFYPGQFDLWGQLTRNPHPNAAGQKLITDLHKALYIPLN